MLTLSFLAIDTDPTQFLGTGPGLESIPGQISHCRHKCTGKEAFPLVLSLFIQGKFNGGARLVFLLCHV